MTYSGQTHKQTVTAFREKISGFIDGPRVTCLVVTRNRVEQAIASIGFYLRQTYNSRNMVIVCESCEQDAERLRTHVAQLARSDIKWVPVKTGTETLGALRNRSLAEADGELVCQWDDDDFYHPTRLSAQVEALLANETRACYLGDHLQYVTAANSMFWCDWYSLRAPYSLPAAPQTGLWWKSLPVRYDEEGPFSQTSEDAVFMRRVMDAGPISIMTGHGHLYVYVTHGKNTWNILHHLELLERKALGRDTLELREHILGEALSLYPVRYPLSVRDKAGELIYEIGTAPPNGAAP